MARTSEPSEYEKITGEKLPPYMEARLMKRGGFAFRARLADGSKVQLGWNREDALEAYKTLRVKSRQPVAEPAIPELAETMLRRHSRGAKVRGLAFEITAADVERMLQEQGLRCAVTGHPFDMKWVGGSRARPYAPSIDRIESSKGYVHGNCRVVCSAVNAALGDLGDKLFGHLFRPLIFSMVEEAIRGAIIPILRDKAWEQKPGKPRRSVLKK
jgi:hypothetical protein